MSLEKPCLPRSQLPPSLQSTMNSYDNDGKDSLRLSLGCNWHRGVIDPFLNLCVVSTALTDTRTTAARYSIGEAIDAFIALNLLQFTMTYLLTSFILAVAAVAIGSPVLQVVSPL